MASPGIGRLATNPAKQSVLVRNKYHEENISGQVWLNPGSCGRKRFNLPITMAVMNVNDNEYSIEKIELEGE